MLVIDRERINLGVSGASFECSPGMYTSICVFPFQIMCMHFDMIVYIHQFSGQPNNSGIGYSYNARCCKKYHATKWTEFQVQHQVVNMKISSNNNRQDEYSKASLRYLCSLKL